MRQTYSAQPRRPRRKLWPLLVVLLLIAAAGIYWFALRDSTEPIEPEPPKSQEPLTEQQPDYQPINLQPVIDSWASRQTADYSIVVWDAQSESIIGQNTPDKQLFAASLYKIYVAYLSLVDFQDGNQNPDDILIAGQTKKQCVDKMIRSSDSPCGEAMMAEIGQLTLNQRVAAMGMTGTIFNGIETTAGDSARILEYIIKGRDLNQENTAFLLDAMQDQPDMYERGLKAGAPEAEWQTKVGWNLDINYHDIGIMTLPDGRQFVVAILGQGSGSPAPIADFASTIYSALSASQPAN